MAQDVLLPRALSPLERYISRPPPIPPHCPHREMFCYIPQRLNTFVLTHWVVWCNEAKNKPMFGQKRTEKSWKCSVCKTWSAVVLEHFMQHRDQSLQLFTHRVV